MLSQKNNQQWDDEQSEAANNFETVKELKKKEMQAMILKNRIKKLQANTEHNMKRLNNHKNKVNELISIREAALSKIKQLKAKKKQQEEEINIKMIKNKNHKESHHERIQKNMQQISIKRFDNYKQILGEHSKNQSIISHNRQKIIQNNKKKRNNVVLDESQSKQKKLEYLQRKNHTVHQQLEQQKFIFQKKNAKKDQQLHQLAKKQLDLLKKQSESQNCYMQMKNKLDSMLGKIRKEKKQKNQSMMASRCHKENMSSGSLYEH